MVLRNVVLPNWQHYGNHAGTLYIEHVAWFICSSSGLMFWVDRPNTVAVTWLISPIIQVGKSISDFINYLINDYETYAMFNVQLCSIIVRFLWMIFTVGNKSNINGFSSHYTDPTALRNEISTFYLFRRDSTTWRLCSCFAEESRCNKSNPPTHRECLSPLPIVSVTYSCRFIFFPNTIPGLLFK